MSELSSSNWSETAASNIATSPNGWPAGTFPNQVEPIGRETMAVIKRFWNRINPVVSCTYSSGVYQYTTPNNLFPASLVNWERFSFVAPTTVTAGDKLQINSLGAKKLYRVSPSGTVAIATGDFVATSVVTVVYYSALDSGAGGFVVVDGLVSGENAAASVSSALSTAIASEASTRLSADNALSAAITSEASARASADSSVISQVETWTSSSNGAFLFQAFPAGVGVFNSVFRHNGTGLTISLTVGAFQAAGSGQYDFSMGLAYSYSQWGMALVSCDIGAGSANSDVVYRTVGMIYSGNQINLRRELVTGTSDPADTRPIVLAIGI